MRKETEELEKLSFEELLKELSFLVSQESTLKESMCSVKKSILIVNDLLDKNLMVGSNEEEMC